MPPLNKTATGTFKKWKDEKQKTAAKVLVFPSPMNGGILDNVNKAWNAVLKKAGTEGIRQKILGLSSCQEVYRKVGKA